MARFLALVVAGMLALPAVAGARDFQHGPRFGMQSQDKAHSKGRGPERAERPDPADRRQRVEPDKGKGRLTQEERRELHRDLDRANREIYRR